MSLYESPWAKYIKERQGMEVLETSEGFATYQIKGAEAYIEDIWVSPEHRNKHTASKIADQVAEIAKEKGCKYLTGSVCPSANNSHTSLLVLLGYGFKLHSSVHNLIYFVKSLES